MAPEYSLFGKCRGTRQPYRAKRLFPDFVKYLTFHITNFMKTLVIRCWNSRCCLEGLTLEMSTLKLLTVPNLRYQLTWLYQVTFSYSFNDAVPQFLQKFAPSNQLFGLVVLQLPPLEPTLLSLFWVRVVSLAPIWHRLLFSKEPIQIKIISMTWIELFENS